jgi:glycerol dehydrogenase
MAKIFRAPPFYIQGSGSIDLLGEKASTLGRNIVVICDAMVLPILSERLSETLRRQDISPTIVPFDADVTIAEMDRLATVVREAGGEVVVGVGGGRTLDTAKGVSRRTALPFISVPTAASTDAPATRGVVIYDDQHALAAVEQMDQNPAFVIADTAIIASAPARLLRAGMGDALTAKFEAEGAWAGTGLSKQGTRPLKTAVLLGAACYRMLLDHGAGAMQVAGTGAVNDDLEYVVEAILLLSAATFENSGLSIAHAIATELGAIEAVRRASLHGEHAAYGTLVQVVAEGRDQAEIDELVAFMDVVGLPRSLAALGFADDLDEGMRAIAETAAQSPFMINQKRPVSAEDLEQAIRAIETRVTGKLDLPRNPG